MIYEYFSYLCTRKHETGAALRATHPCFPVRKSTRNERKVDFWYAKVLKYFQITSFFRLKLMQLEKNRYKKRNE